MAFAALLGVVAGLGLAAADQHVAANAVWGVVTGALLVPLTWSVIRSLLHRDVGVDAIALVAMAGALARWLEPTAREAMGRRAAAEVRERFELAAMVHGFERQFSALV